MGSGNIFLLHIFAFRWKRNLSVISTRKCKSQKHLNAFSLLLQKIINNLFIQFGSETSVKSLEHYTQSFFNNGKFRQFDYGISRNLELYGNKNPPDYPLENITAPIYLIHSSADILNDPKVSIQFYFLIFLVFLHNYASRTLSIYINDYQMQQKNHTEN